MKFTTATFVACAAIFATQQADAKFARGVLTPPPGVKGPGGDGMILVRGGRGWRSVHPITGRTCFPGPDDGPICLCGKGEICTQERYIGCATGKCESVQQRRLRRPPHYHMKHEEEYREVASKCDTQYKKNSINWAECINAGFREISGYPAEDDEEFAGSNELGCYLFPQAQVCRQRRLQRSNNNDDDDEEFAGSNELGCYLFPQAQVCR